MKKFLLGLIILTGVLLASGSIYSAPDIGTGKGGMTQNIGKNAGFNTNVNQYSLSETIGRGIKIALTMVGTIFFALTIYAGFLWMTAQGNGEQVEKATGIFKTATIGLIVVIASYSITAFVMLFVARSTT